MVSTRTLVAGLVVSSFALVAALAAPASNPRLTNDILHEPETDDSELLGESSPQCPYARKGGGMGGNTATCEFACTTRDLVVIKVASADPDAEVSGNGSCGNGGASCAGTGRCTGSGSRMAGSPARGTCKGSSSELWKSAITVDCEAAPASTPCSVGITCPEEGSENE